MRIAKKSLALALFVDASILVGAFVSYQANGWNLEHIGFAALIPAFAIVLFKLNQRWAPVVSSYEDMEDEDYEDEDDIEPLKPEMAKHMDEVFGLKRGNRG